MIELSYIVWDPKKYLFLIPYIHHPLTYYGLLFAVGFILAFYRAHVWIKTLVSNKQHARILIDKLAWYLIVGTVIGARLGHVFFYDWPFFKEHPLQIFAVWKGGLASHGGILGIIIALSFFRLSIRKKFPQLTYLRWFDCLALSTPIMASCIRIGNFINQEIVGTITNVPWAVLFLHPAENVLIAPRHPVQLYEAIFYLFLFFGLMSLWDIIKDQWKPGKLAGLFLVLLFTFRFFIDFLKVPQEMGGAVSILQMGQILSLPIILLGLILFFRPSKSLQAK